MRKRVPQKILGTGGGDFLGSAIVRLLVEGGIMSEDSPAVRESMGGSSI